MRVDNNGRTMIEVRKWITVKGETVLNSFGVIHRKVTEGKTYRASVNGKRKHIRDPHNWCYCIVNKLPEDLDTRGYE